MRKIVGSLAVAAAVLGMTGTAGAVEKKLPPPDEPTPIELPEINLEPGEPSSSYYDLCKPQPECEREA